MSDAGKAVFLSYASQDAEAAKRIAEALRAAGVEVWFDQSELRGGDAWDQKIRKQIQECTLFLAVISRHTQERAEGYFRLEWKLAVDRSHLMAEDVAFIVPVVIDSTPDATARVPEKFREVQWTRLPNGETPPAFAERVKALLADENVVGRDRSPSPGLRSAGRTPPRSEVAAFGLSRYSLLATADDAALQRTSPRLWPWLAVAAIGVAASVALVIWQPWRKPENPASGLTPPVAEARQLVQQARSLMWGPNISRADLETGEQLFEKAKVLDPTDAEVWAIGALTDMRYFDLYFDRSDARKGQARAKAARALKLAPDSFEARLVQVCVLSSVVADFSIRPEAELLIKSLSNEKPEDSRVLAAQGGLFTVEGRDEEAAVYYRRANDPISEGWAYFHLGRMADAEAAADRAILTGHSVAGLLLKAHVKVYGREDLEAAQAAIDQLPASELLEGEPAARAAGIRFFRGEPDKVLEILRAVPYDWIWYGGCEVPKAMFTGWAHHLANHPAAAEADCRAALRLIDERLATQSNNPPLIGHKAHVLALLGERDEAERNLRLDQQLQGQRDGQITVETAGIYVLLGRRDEIIDVLAAALKDPKAGLFLHADLRFNPVWDPLRGLPKFEALLRETRPKGAKPFDDQQPAPSPGAERKSVAVLAFANLSDDKENEYFSDGISEELLNVLAKIPGLRVAARTSAFYFKGRNATAQEIGEKLGVAHLVEGSVRKAGTRVRIAVRLSRAATGEQLWSETYERELKDIFALQDEIAQIVVGQLRGVLTGATADPATQATIRAEVKAATKGGTSHPEAYQLFLQGRFFANQLSRESLEHTVGFYRQALDLDPSFALAWAALSRTYEDQIMFGLSDLPLSQLAEQARAAAQQALVLEPDLAEGHSALMRVRMEYDFDWSGAEESERKALALAPVSATIVSDAMLLTLARGRVEKATELARRSVELDPVSAEARVWLLWTYLLAGRYHEAEAEARRVIDLSPTATWSYAGLSLACLFQGRLDEALASAEREKEGWSRLTAIALVRHAQRRRPESDAALSQLIEKYGTIAAYNVAWICAYRGDADQTFAWLERAHNQHDSGLMILKLDPFLRNVHGDPRWAALLKKIGLADNNVE